MLATDLAYLHQRPVGPPVPVAADRGDRRGAELDRRRDQRRATGRPRRRGAAPSAGRLPPRCHCTALVAATSGGRPMNAAAPLLEVARPADHRRQRPTAVVHGVDIAIAPRRERRVRRRVGQRQDADLPVAARPPPARRRRHRRRLSLRRQRPRRARREQPVARAARDAGSAPSSRTRRPTSTRRSASGDQLAEVLRVRSGCGRREAKRAGDRAARAARPAPARSSSTASTRTSCPAGCCSACSWRSRSPASPTC